MTKNILAICFGFLISYLYAQERGDYIWQLGHKSSPQTHSSPGSLILDFKDENLSISTIYRPVNLGYFNCSISDSNGNLVLYSNGCKIFYTNNSSIENSENLSPGDVDLEWCIQDNYGYPIPEGGIFLPILDDSLILLLHQRLMIVGPPLKVFIDALFYTLLSKVGENYKIIEKTVPILQDSLSDGRLEAIKTDDNSGWWVIQGKRNSNSYYTIKIGTDIVDTVFTQTLGDITVKKGEAAGQSVFSPDGTKYARYSPADDLFLFDFDLRTGILSNYRKIHVADSGTNSGLAFSANSQFLYACTQLDMYQFDTNDDNIEASKVHVGHYDGYVSPFPTTFYHLQLAPDCKIYGIPANGVSIMHVINEPDKKGIECDFEQHGLQLPVSNSITLPNFPVFRVGPDVTCDSIVSNVIDQKPLSGEAIIYPNPAENYLQVELNDNWNLSDKILVNISDLDGQVLVHSDISKEDNKLLIPISDLAPGIYFITITSNKLSLVRKFLKIN